VFGTPACNARLHVCSPVVSLGEPCVVWSTHEADVSSVAESSTCVRLQVVELEQAPSAAALAVGTGEAALPAVAVVDFAADSARDGA
jgi:hypothetical protein